MISSSWYSRALPQDRGAQATTFCLKERARSLPHSHFKCRFLGKIDHALPTKIGHALSPKIGHALSPKIGHALPPNNDSVSKSLESTCASYGKAYSVNGNAYGHGCRLNGKPFEDVAASVSAKADVAAKPYTPTLEAVATVLREDKHNCRPAYKRCQRLVVLETTANRKSSAKSWFKDVKTAKQLWTSCSNGLCAEDGSGFERSQALRENIKSKQRTSNREEYSLTSSRMVRPKSSCRRPTSFPLSCQNCNSFHNPGHSLADQSSLNFSDRQKVLPSRRSTYTLWKFDRLRAKCPRQSPGEVSVVVASESKHASEVDFRDSSQFAPCRTRGIADGTGQQWVEAATNDALVEESTLSQCPIELCTTQSLTSRKHASSQHCLSCLRNYTYLWNCTNETRTCLRHCTYETRTCLRNCTNETRTCLVAKLFKKRRRQSPDKRSCVEGVISKQSRRFSSRRLTCRAAVYKCSYHYYCFRRKYTRRRKQRVVLVSGATFNSRISNPLFVTSSSATFNNRLAFRRTFPTVVRSEMSSRSPADALCCGDAISWPATLVAFVFTCFVLVVYSIVQTFTKLPRLSSDETMSKACDEKKSDVSVAHLLKRHRFRGPSSCGSKQDCVHSGLKESTSGLAALQSQQVKLSSPRTVNEPKLTISPSPREAGSKLSSSREVKESRATSSTSPKKAGSNLSSPWNFNESKPRKVMEFIRTSSPSPREKSSNLSSREMALSTSPLRKLDPNLTINPLSRETGSNLPSREIALETKHSSRNMDAQIASSKTSLRIMDPKTRNIFKTSRLFIGSCDWSRTFLCLLLMLSVFAPFGAAFAPLNTGFAPVRLQREVTTDEQLNSSVIMQGPSK